MLVVLTPGLYMKRTGPITSGIWNSMPAKTVHFLLNCLCEQARQSNFKGGSPAETLILNNIYDWVGT